MFELYQYSRALKDTPDAPEYVTRLHPFEHQEILRILSKSWRRFLVVNATGTGKACLLIRAAEDLLRITNGKYPERVVALFQGPLTVSDYKHQIAWVCTQGKYAMPDMSRRQISSNIAERYQVTTYRKFFDEINAPQAHENYKNCMFIFEEVHNLRNVAKNDNEAANAIYSKLHSFIHKVEGAFVACVTASPMINETSEIAPIMNLLLPLDRQLPTDWNYNMVTKEQLEPFMRGLITYVPEIRSVKEVEIGDRISTVLRVKVPVKGEPIVTGQKQQQPETEFIEHRSTTNLFFVDLQGLQKEVFLSEKARLGEEFTGHFMAIPIPISLMVFPGGEYSSDMKKLNKYITNPQGDVYIPRQSFIEDLQKNLWQYSAKYHHIVESELNAPRTMTVGKTTLTLPGPSLAFVISPRVNGPGAIALAMCLEAFGFERYDSNLSPFVDSQAKPCGYPGRQLKISKRKRYVLLAGDVSNKIDNMRSLFNSPENMFGEYIQVIIASEVAKEGINIYNTTRAYSVTQSWHHAGEYQFFSRILRATSQTELRDEILKRFVYAGETFDTLKDFQLEVQIKKIVSRVDGESIEADAYMKYVEEKRFYTNRVFQIMKELAYDRYLVGIDGARRLEPDEIDYNNFILSEQFDEMKLLIYKKLVDVYRVFENGFNLNEVMGYLDGKVSRYLLKREFIATTLMWIVRSEKIFLNSSGVEVYTKIDKRDKNYFIPVRLWMRDINVDRGILWYNRNISFQKLAIEDSVDNVLWSERERRVKHAMDNFVEYLDGNYRELSGNFINFQAKWFESLGVSYQSFLIRWALDEDNFFWNPDKEEFDTGGYFTEKMFVRMIIDITTDRYLFKIKEPVTNINLISRVLGMPSLSRGRKSFDDSEIKMKQVKLVPGEEQDPRARDFYVDISRIAGSVIKNSDDIRVISDEKEWRKLEPYEVFAYKFIIESMFEERYAEVIERAKSIGAKVWAMKKLNGKFIIMPIERGTSVEDQRFALKGVSCDSKAKNELIEMYEAIGGSISGDSSKLDLCKLIETKMIKLGIVALV